MAENSGEESVVWKPVENVFTIMRGTEEVAVRRDKPQGCTATPTSSASIGRRQKMADKKLTYHAMKRIDERFGNYDKLALVNGARHSGLTDSDLEEVPDLLAFYRKKAHSGKRVFIYAGFVFVFFTSSKRLITMYPLPEELMEDYMKVEYKEEEKREKYRRSRR